MPSPNTPKILAIALARRIDFNSCLTVLCTAVVIVFLFFNRQLGHDIQSQVTENKAVINAVREWDEKLILDFMTRTVDRWEKLQRDNPQLRVPNVVEPIDKPHLSEQEMERKRTPK